MTRGGARARVALGAVSAVALACLCAVALVHPLQHLGFRARSDPWTAALVLGAAAFAFLAAGALSPVVHRSGQEGALRWAIPALAAGVAWPVFIAALFPLSVLFGVPTRPFAALAALALAGVLVLDPTRYAEQVAAVPLAAGAAALLAVNVGLAGAIALLGLLAAVQAVASARADAPGSIGTDRRPIIAASAARSEPSVDPAALVGPALLVAAAGFWAPAPSLGVPLLALNYPAVGAAVGGAVGTVAQAGLRARERRVPGPVLSGGGALAGYLAGALWAGMSLAAALGA